MRYFCTYFNAGYLDRALVLLESMRRHIPEFTLYVLAFDDAVVDFFATTRFPEVRVERLAAFEARNPDVAAVKAERSRAEYFFTCTGAWIQDVLERHPDMDILTYLDADLCFFSSPEPVFMALADKSILIAEHDVASENKQALIYGRYNVGLLTFRNSPTGRACIRMWREQCVAWCFDRIEDGKFADQKYLDEWPRLYGDQVAIAPRGINTGPWGLHDGHLRADGKGGYLIHGQPLVVYHFQGVRLFSPRHYYLGFYFPFNPLFVLSALYEPYVRNLTSVADIYKLPPTVGHGRYGVRGGLYRMATGYWVGHPVLSWLVWVFHHFVLRIA